MCAENIKDSNANADETCYQKLPFLHLEVGGSWAEEDSEQYDSQELTTVDQIDDRKGGEYDSNPDKEVN